jgi:hypothetical protein
MHSVRSSFAEITIKRLNLRFLLCGLRRVVMFRGRDAGFYHSALFHDLNLVVICPQGALNE